MGSSFELSRDEMMILCEVKMYLMREKGRSANAKKVTLNEILNNLSTTEGFI